MLAEASFHSPDSLDSYFPFYRVKRAKIIHAKKPNLFACKVPENRINALICGKFLFNKEKVLS